MVPRDGLLRVHDGRAMIEYTDALDGITPEHLTGFFVEWTYSPPPEIHLRMLAGSDHFVLARDATSGQIVGYIAALTDGVLSSFISFLEVLPAYQNQGIGRGLMERMLERLSYLPKVDLLCGPAAIPFYERFGMKDCSGMVLRRSIAESLAKTDE